MKIYFINDTSGNHGGCDATMSIIKENLENVIHWQRTHDTTINENAYKQADVVVLHGEGTLHHNQSSAMRMMYLIWRAQQDGKRTAIFNATVQEMTIWESIFNKVDYFSVREPFSYNYVKPFAPHVKLFRDLTIDERWIADADRKEGIYYGGLHPDMFKTGFDTSLDLYSFETTIRALASAKLYLTGQYHGIIASILANCLFLPFKSTSWKIESLLDWCGLKVLTLDNISNLSTSIDNILVREKEFAHIRENLLSKPQMKIDDFQEMIYGK